MTDQVPALMASPTRAAVGCFRQAATLHELSADEGRYLRIWASRWHRTVRITIGSVGSFRSGPPSQSVDQKRTAQVHATPAKPLQRQR